MTQEVSEHDTGDDKVALGMTQGMSDDDTEDDTWDDRG